MGPNYPGDWDDRRAEVLSQQLNRCANCRRSDVGLEVHHIVPVGQAGSHRLSNLVGLCCPCHRAAHEKRMAPRVQWYTNGELSEDEFVGHKRLWKRMRDRLGVPRFDPDAKCVYIPLADAEGLIERLET